MKVVVNASPVIFLAKIELMDKLPGLYNEVIIPEGVINEIQKHHDEASRWLHHNRTSYEVTAVEVPAHIHAWDLGKGESEVIAAAQMTKDSIAALDDKAARNCAAALNLNVIGTIGLILRMQQAKLIDDATGPLTSLRDQGYRINNTLYQHALKIASTKD